MRIKFLLALLLLAGSLAAQPICHIFDLTATPLTPDPNSCQYAVVLNFQHDGTTNQFAVKGNGVDYGLFTYNQLPLTLGSFTAGTSPTSLHFIVADAILADCADEVTIDIPACSSASACAISNLTVQTGACGPLGLTYELWLNFEVTGANNDFFEVTAGNGINLGVFPLSALPLHIPVFPWAGGLVDHIKVCINDAPDCCKEIEFQAPDCLLQNPCGIVDLIAVADSCTSDSTYRLKINFQVLSPSTTDSFLVSANGNYFGTYSYSQLPLIIPNFPWEGGPVDYVKVCVTNDCCKAKEFQVPDCLPIYPCGIKDLSVTTDSCTTDSTFRIKINFAVNDSTAVDSFSLFGNSQFIGQFGMNQLPLQLDSFLWNHSVFNTIRVCTGDAPGCCKEFLFIAPSCLPFGPCEITKLLVQPGDCTSDSTYKVTVYFQTTNPGDGTFTLWANGDSVGVFPLTAIPLMIPDFPTGPNTVGVIRICMNDTLPTSTLCCRDADFNAPNCNPAPCAIHDLTVDPGDCHLDLLTYNLSINFQVQNPGNDFFEVWAGNGIYLGLFPLSQLPLNIPNFPWGGGPVDHIKICVNDHPDCCTTLEFQAPTCFQNTPCNISDLVVDPGTCTSDSTYNLVINFQVSNPLGDIFVVYANGVLFGTFNLNQLPLTIPNFPWNGGAGDFVKICVGPTTAGGTLCCETKDFLVPTCLLGNDCSIHDLVVDTGDCSSDSTYHILLNFLPVNPPADTFRLSANGVYFGTFNLNQLPLAIPNFPWNGGPNDVVKVCFGNDVPGTISCCATLEFAVPDCLPGTSDCLIHDFVVETGACNSDSTYHLTLNFQVNNSPVNIFAVFANGVFFGSFNLNQLPLTIPNFPWNGGNNDVIKVCILLTPNIPPICCETKEFAVPACLFGTDCNIHDFVVDPGICTSDSTYSLIVNFQVTNPPSSTFGVWANGTFFGTFNLSQLPLTIPNFPWNGGVNDVIKVCFSNNSGAISCCETKEFAVPNCLFGNDCNIHDLVVETGDCNLDDSTYHLTLNFLVANPPSSTFSVWANGVFFGNFTLNQLPLTIPNFPWNGGNNDVVKVCFATTPGAPPTCCETKEFPVPDCFQTGDCSVHNLAVQTGDCSSDSTYHLTLNFTVTNPPGNSFGVWANGMFLGVFNLSQLPLSIPNFPWNGGANDDVKVCFGNAGVVNCCAVVEFPVPDCLGQGGACEIHDLNVDTGDCSSDSTYHLIVNFQVSNPPSDVFSLWANGVFFGTYNLNQLPLNIPNFPWNGGNNDVVKVCFVSPAGSALCCAVKEFEVPDCLLNNPCNIYDLHVVRTPCLCGQFFALVSFNHVNGTGSGVDIIGNGTNYGTFPYNTPQPIIVGPFVGDGTTEHEFEVHDHQLNDCHDTFVLGKVDCTSALVHGPNDGSSLSLSPNPTGNWLNVSAKFPNGGKVGQTNVEIYHADGRLMQTKTVADGSNFQLDVSGLPAAMYRLVMQTELGRLEATFAKL